MELNSSFNSCYDFPPTFYRCVDTKVELSVAFPQLLYSDDENIVYENKFLTKRLEPKLVS